MGEKMAAKPKTIGTGRIAVVGDRELVIGYRLLGIDDTHITAKEDAAQIMQKLFYSNEFGLIVASQSVREALSLAFRAKVEASIEPLVIFMPSLGEGVKEESISDLARRVLGVDIKMSE
ncbi:MAG: V-type ATP synthase subunit F [Nitrososphaerales archaeon]